MYFLIMYNMCIQYVIDYVYVYIVQINYKGLKITVCLRSWDKLGTRNIKNSNCQF